MSYHRRKSAVSNQLNVSGQAQGSRGGGARGPSYSRVGETDRFRVIPATGINNDPHRIRAALAVFHCAKVSSEVAFRSVVRCCFRLHTARLISLTSRDHPVLAGVDAAEHAAARDLLVAAKEQAMWSADLATIARGFLR